MNVKGSLRLQLAEVSLRVIENDFQRAVEIANRYGAKSLALRAATSLARLWQSQGKRKGTYDLLAPVYGWFTEGFDTADLQDAQSLLDKLKV